MPRGTSLFEDAEAMKQAAKEQIAAYQKSAGYKSHREWGTTTTQDVNQYPGNVPGQEFPRRAIRKLGEYTSW